jgi:hypothetical protein
MIFEIPTDLGDDIKIQAEGSLLRLQLALASQILICSTFGTCSVFVYVSASPRLSCCCTHELGWVSLAAFNIARRL